MKRPKGAPLRLEISPGFSLCAALVWFLDRQGLFTLALFAALVHEAGHFLVLCLFRARPTLIRLELTGAVMRFPAGALSFAQEAAAAAAGPLAGALLCAVAALLNAPTLAGVSAVLTGFNLLPALPLDGGRLLRCLLLSRRERERAEPILRAAALVTALALLAGGLVLTLTLRCGWSLLLMGAALLLRQKEGDYSC